MKKWSTFIASVVFLSLLALPNSAFARELFTPNKDQVGLNVHWALGGFDRDDVYERTLDGTNTRWAREHFYTEVFHVDQPGAWVDRYDGVLAGYQRQNVKVVGMLAYNFENGDFSAPDLDRWEAHVRDVVGRYSGLVHVWEVWNEPNSSSFLSPNNIETYGPILVRTYDVIKSIDPDATVLTGGLAGFDRWWTATLLKEYRNKFDALAFHAYSCREFLRDGDLRALESELDLMGELLDRYDYTNNVWITENGCSMGSLGITRSMQERYLRDSTNMLIDTGWVDRVFVYNIRDYDTGDWYEDNFGLLRTDNHWNQAMRWYDAIVIGPYNRHRLLGGREQELAVELRTRLARFFPDGIPISSENWGRLVNAYVYGGYPVQAIVQTIRYGEASAAVHPEIPHAQWSELADYKRILARDFTANGQEIFAYGQARIDVGEEQARARTLRSELGRYSVRMPAADQWGSYVNAYIYGGYSVQDIARALKYGGKTVHASIPLEHWQSRGEYIEYSAKPL